MHFCTAILSNLAKNLAGARFGWICQKWPVARLPDVGPKSGKSKSFEDNCNTYTVIWISGFGSFHHGCSTTQTIYS